MMIVLTAETVDTMSVHVNVDGKESEPGVDAIGKREKKMTKLKKGLPIGKPSNRTVKRVP